MQIIKTQNDYNSYNIRLINDGKVLDIYQIGSDIGISCRYESFEVISAIKFDISNENMQIYQIFCNLYENIVDGNVLAQTKNSPEAERRKEIYKNSSWYENNVQDKMVIVYSDAYPMNCPNIVKLKKGKNKIELEFEQIDGKDYGQIKIPYVITIDIRMSGSRLYEFSNLFRNLFLNLQTVCENNKIKVLK